MDDASEDQFLAGLVGISSEFSLYGGRNTKTNAAWQWDIEAGILSQFNMDSSSDDLLNTDFLVGFPVTYANDPLLLRFRVMHQSSHLGDEFILSGEAPDRINLSLEFVELLAAYRFNEWRFYGGGSTALRKSPESLEARTLQAGLDYRETLTESGMDLIGGINYRIIEETEWEPGVGVQAGVLLGNRVPEASGLSLRFEYYDGPLPFGQFYTTQADYLGLGIHFRR
jgi:hypothetical protein